MKFRELIPFLYENQQEIKVHCATGSEDVYAPKNAFLTGNFKIWQENQTQKNFEWLVIDDGSEDDTEKFFSELSVFQGM